MDRGAYKSCIKVRGIKLLPPLISAERRIEINEYKRRAIDIEKRLKYEREWKAFFDSVDPTKDKESDAPIVSRKPATSLEHKVVFEGGTETVHRTVVEVPRNQKNLVSCVFDVAEYNQDGVVVLSDTSVEICDSKKCDDKPKLVRSNSYTLESPSPALIQYMKDREANSLVPMVGPCEDSAYETLEERESSQNDGSHIFNRPLLGENFSSISNEMIDELIKKHFGDFPNDTSEVHLLDSRLDAVESAVQNLLDRQTSEIQLDNATNENQERPDTVSRSEVNTSIFETSPPHLIDFDSDCCESTVITDFQRNATHTEIDSDPLGVLMTLYDYKKLTCTKEKPPSCSRQLFSNTKEDRQAREKWAGTILTAAARGFFVRRLKRTERVQNLIQTIHDTIVCALNLHRDDIDSIPEADIELHRRLIVQLTSACLEFYDTFFNLTTKQQMALIAQDRQRQLDKARREKNLKNESSRSTLKSQRQSINKMSDSKSVLAPSFAA